MKATVVRVTESRIDVTVRGREQGLYTAHRPELHEQLRCGDVIEVRRQTNNPFLIPE